MHGGAGCGQIPRRTRQTLKEKPDADLFRQALDGVTPLTPSSRAPPHKPLRRAPKHDAKPSLVADTLSDHGATEEPLTEFLRPGISRIVLRKLRRERLQDTLDLHGLSSDEARKLLLEFLHNSTRQDLRHVCVIHGKGRQIGGGEGILKIRTRHWLTQCTPVLAFCEAPPNAGGGGAVLVLLKSGN
jgi:DNA-nicking Smr family endonuclease